MVEIVKQGTKNLADCLDCGSILKYAPRDIHKRYDPPRGPYEMEGFDYYFINCPCGSTIDVTSKISGRIARRVEEIEKERRMSDYDL